MQNGRPEAGKDNKEIKQTGPICLGHIIEDKAHLDFPLNRSEGPAWYPEDMPIEPFNYMQFKWTKTDKGEWHSSSGANVPLAATVGITARADVEAAMKKSLSTFWMIERLEAQYIQPTDTFVNRALKHPKIEESIQGKLSWTVYMITGLLVARGKKSKKTEESQSVLGSAGLGVSATKAAGGHINVGVSREQDTQMEAEGIDDHIWALRLAEVSKPWSSKRWKIKTFFEGAVFEEGDNTNPSLDRSTVERTLTEEGLGGFQVIGEGEGGSDFFVIGPKPE
ncbi:hypothetical protein O1611_g5512 [Lasiodiplodia mahajangana]|uniref:Uncharacterized protein n=1 Tax=Lasiodiplodia mahajangana TaxID=1108764 RepID=A0ACC2JL96_9PEZI|nr:hypothetical protein O1611_g5512 [Lasiodiplodia mahajangana]